MTQRDTRRAAAAPVAPAVDKSVTIDGSTIVVRELGEMLGLSNVDIVKELMKRGVMASVNQTVDYDTAVVVATELGFEVGGDKAAGVDTPEQEVAAAAEADAAAGVEAAPVEEEDPAKLKSRPPVVTVMGHVDHGKTSILDAIRQTNVTASEVGAITQHIGAYQVEVKGQKITFIDTPGHEAFTQLRARGASVTDIAVLVVAADDGVMPQTREAIDHARAANVPIIVAINKIDLPAANPDNVKQQLVQNQIVIEEFGGEVIAVPVSAKTREGLDDLLENILLVAEVAELKANPDRPAEGVIVESRMEQSRGPMATVIVQKGTLQVGDVVLAGPAYGKVKAMFDDKGGRVKDAGPAMPVELMGLSTVPRSGDPFRVLDDEREARDAAEQRERDLSEGTGRAVTLEAVSGDIKAGRVKDLNILIKADTVGSIEAIRASIEKLSGDEVRVNVISTATGNVSESDVMLATASRAIIVGFTVKIDPGAKRTAETERVDVRLYNIIYELIEDIDKAVKGLMDPVIIEVTDGHAEVRAKFRVRGGTIAGCMVTDGIVRRNSLARVLRGGEMIHESRVSSLRRFKDDVREVSNGLECGIGVERFETFEEGDIIEAFHTEEKG
ncbi:MAG TPA: translation initiation factor IF-2 [Dehalococcoidia bacterium]|nr:translation initiation factor IF-2 [Dehalococcoidia bacterium]